MPAKPRKIPAYRLHKPTGQAVVRLDGRDHYLGAMIDLQRLTGMRPGEVTIMRTCDLDTSGEVWAYTPEVHKGEHHDRRRTIFLGPRAQAMLGPWLKTEPTAYLSSPAEARAERFAKLRAGRKTKVQPSQRYRARPGAKRRPGPRYTTHTYYKAIRAACAQAGVEAWHPHQLRHSAATRVRREFGLDVAQTVLGHSDLKTSEIYAERDSSKARAAMARIG